MVSVRRKYEKARTCTALVPVCLSVAPLVFRPVTGTLLLCGAIFLATACVPAFRHRENLAVFLLVWLCGIPVNLYLTAHALRFLGLIHSPFYGIVYGFLIMHLLFSAEQICFGICTRLLWRRQYRLIFE